MWLGIKLDMWALIISAAALFLCLPLAVLANILTPRLLNWWADRSTRSAQARATTLRRELEEYEQHYGLIDAPLLFILLMVERALLLACVAVCSLACAFALAFLLAWGSPSPQPHFRDFAATAAVSCGLMLIFAYFIGFWSSSQIARYVRRHSAAYRDYLKDSIEKLESHRKP
jgi:ABC-type multidrug transport system fused ATPase/permease subunit